MTWQVLIAVDPEINADLVTWVVKTGGAAVSEAVPVNTAAQLPVAITARKNGPLALLVSTLCPELPAWGDTVATVLASREEATRVIVMAEGTADGVPGPQGSLESSPLLKMASVFEGTETGDELQFDYDAMGQALWGGDLPSAKAPIAPASRRALPDTPSEVPSVVKGGHRLSGLFRRKDVTPPSPPATSATMDDSEDIDLEPVPTRVVLPPSKLIAVVGGKGGVGKTTVAATMIAEGARVYGSTLGIDFDYLKPNLSLHFWEIDDDLPNLDLLFDAIDVSRGAPDRGGGEDPESERRMIDDWMNQLRPPMKGVLVVPGPWRRLTTTLPPEHVPGAILDWALEQNEPLVICDTDPALDEAAEAVITRAGQDGVIVLVTTPEYDAIAETDRLRQQITQGLGVPAERLMLIINHRGAPKGAISTKEILSVHLPGIALLAELPWVPQAAHAALRNHRPVQNWPRKIHWEAILAAATGRTPDAGARKKVKKAKNRKKGR